MSKARPDLARADALVASIIDRGNYLDWYCTGTEGRVSERVERALKRRGFSHKAYF